jgi:hypothetical protein
MLINKFKEDFDSCKRISIQIDVCKNVTFKFRDSDFSTKYEQSTFTSSYLQPQHVTVRIFPQSALSSCTIVYLTEKLLECRRLKGHKHLQDTKTHHSPHAHGSDGVFGG